jgi:adenine-specific DNA glycosylase
MGPGWLKPGLTKPGLKPPEKVVAVAEALATHAEMKCLRQAPLPNTAPVADACAAAAEKTPPAKDRVLAEAEAAALQLLKEGRPAYTGRGRSTTTRGVD